MLPWIYIPWVNRSMDAAVLRTAARFACSFPVRGRTQKLVIIIIIITVIMKYCKARTSNIKTELFALYRNEICTHAETNLTRQMSITMITSTHTHVRTHARTHAHAHTHTHTHTHTQVLSRQAYFCRDKRRVLWRQTRVCRHKTSVATKRILGAAPANDTGHPLPLLCPLTDDQPTRSNV